ncbi:TPA: hypothetical protein ACGO1T_000878 [Streptococcus suis]
MKIRRREYEILDAVEWDGSQRAYEEILKMCPRYYEITMENGNLSISDPLDMFERCLDLGGFVIVENGEVSAIPRKTFKWQYEIVEEEEK